MLSEEEIKRGLTEELGRTITANEYGLSTRDFSESIEILESALKYIKQLETDKQKLIEKLEGDISKFNTYKNIHQLSKEGVGAMNYAQEILKILKGEN